MASFVDNAYSFVQLDNTADLPSQQDLKNQLEKGTDDTKVETMKRYGPRPTAVLVMLTAAPAQNIDHNAEWYAMSSVKEGRRPVEMADISRRPDAEPLDACYTLRYAFPQQGEFA